MACFDSLTWHTTRQFFYAHRNCLFPASSPFLLFFHLRFLSLLSNVGKMVANGVQASLTPGHFLFTSESVGEGHPGA